MPKFYRQNKKRIDPRYFLDETTNRDLNEAIDSRFDGEMDAMKGIRPGRDMMSDPSYSSGYRSISPEQKSFNTELLRIFSNRLEKIDDKLRKDNERDPRLLPLRTLIKKVDDSRAGRDGLSDDEYNQLDAAMKDESSLQAFNTRILAMLDDMQSDVDTDNDGIPDEKELAIIDKGEI